MTRRNAIGRSAARLRRGGGPRRRAVDRAAMCPDWDYVGKLAFRRQVAGNVLVVGGYGAQFFAGTLMWVEDDDGFPGLLLKIVERCDEIGVAGYKYDAVEVVFDVIDKHLGRNVYIGAFLFGFPHGCGGDLRAGFAGFLCKRISCAEALVVALDDCQFRSACGKCGEVDRLPHLRGGLCRIVVYTGGEILDGQYLVLFWSRQKGVCKCDHIKPLVLREAKHSVVQVESVDINDSLFLHIALKGKGWTCAQPCTASPRLSGRLTTHQGVRRYCIKSRERRQGGKF